MDPADKVNKTLFYLNSSKDAINLTCGHALTEGLIKKIFKEKSRQSLFEEQSCSNCERLKTDIFQ